MTPPRPPSGSQATSQAATPVQVRTALVEALRLDLVGPEPGGPYEDEVLPIPPSAWYLTGFLVPFEAPPEEREDPTSGEGVEVAERPVPADDDASPDRASARRAWLPSSLGLSVLVPAAAKEARVVITWGDYRARDPREAEPADGESQGEEPEPAPEDEENARPPEERPTVHWLRTPRRHEVVLPLPRGGGPPVGVPVTPDDALVLVVSARTVNGMGSPSGNVRSVSVFLVNHRDPTPDPRRDESRVFQAGFSLHTDVPLVARPDPRRFGIDQWDDRLADLHYRDAVEYAVGHGVSSHAVVGSDGSCREVHTTWIPSAEVEKVVPSAVPGVQFGMEALAAAETPEALQASLEPLVREYRAWQDRQRAKATAEGLPQERLEMAGLLLERAAFAAERIEDGIARLADPTAFEAFRTANRAMAAAARRREAQLRGQAPQTVPAPTWRPFQLAFLLMNLRGILDPLHPDREMVDLLFFPTGGGKTEAYLGLAAFTIVLRRLRDPTVHSSGLTVLMRYTLRLLTLDQLARASALVCALELERQQRVDELGPWPFEIGLWVGLAATPNRMGRKGDNDRYSARARVIAYKNDARRGSPIPLESCPWCGTRFTPNSFNLDHEDHPSNLRITCANRSCDFTRNRALPILTVDEPVYRRLPCFLVATVDKFAALPWVGDTGALFNRVDRYDKEGFYGPASPGRGARLERSLLPPDLIIQDELHLISGPLGSVAGLYEIVIDHLCSVEREGHLIRPKVVASTATVRRAESQIQALFARSRVEVFPPPGPDRRDSFFALTVPSSEKNARLYLGVAAQGRSLKVLLLRAYLTLLGASGRAWLAAGGAKNPTNPADPYMTLLGYFGSLRELGGSRRIVEDEVRSRLSTYGARLRVGETAGLFADRVLTPPVELTSRESTAKVAEARQRLAVRHDDREHADDRVDVAIATNMISVGLDITRLGLMVVLGQPKSSAEYIQATSRVGRDDERPGLVVTLLNLHRPRDRSHYERFEAFHEVFYRMVEATSVTPFAPRCVDRCIPAVSVALARHGDPSLTHARNARAILDRIGDLGFVGELLARRGEGHVKGLSITEATELRTRLKERVADLLDDWFKVADRKRKVGAGLQYANESGSDPPLLHDPLDPVLTTLPAEERKFRAHRSMRDVEPVVNLWARTLDNVEVPAEEDVP